MSSRKIIISDSARMWLAMSDVQIRDFDEACANIDINMRMDPCVTQQRTATKVVIKVFEAKTTSLQTKEFFQKVYVIQKRNTVLVTPKTTIISKDEDGKLKELNSIPENYTISINGGDYEEDIDIIREKVFVFYLKD